MNVDTFLWTAVKAGIDLSSNIVVSALVEAIFPAYSTETNVWVGGLEAFLEITFFLLLSSRVSAALSKGVSGYEFAAVPYGTLLGIFLLSNAYRKLLALQERITDGLYERRASNYQEKHPEDSANEQ